MMYGREGGNREAHVSDLAWETGIIGESRAARELRALVQRVAPLRLPVLIQGPTGAGKELVARALHALGGRGGRFVAVNVCAIPESMFEATLFGHVRGAFTGAVADSAGYLAEADGGTLFLDEISGLSLVMQTKLLRALETREFRPVGARRDRASDFRVVAATNEDVQALVGDGRFRGDLAHRLNAVVVDVPPLSARTGDVSVLARHFAGAAGGPALTPAALRVLEAREWPGNVRQLRNVVERALALSAGREVDGADLEGGISASGTGALAAPASDARDHAGRELLERVLAACGWDTGVAAERLGVHRATIYRRMQRLGIPRPRFSPRDGDDRPPGRAASAVRFGSVRALRVRAG
jgi:DNA-binding NtrC family response regulator